jgi:hypothetical protein
MHPNRRLSRHGLHITMGPRIQHGPRAVQFAVLWLTTTVQKFRRRGLPIEVVRNPPLLPNMQATSNPAKAGCYPMSRHLLI